MWSVKRVCLYYLALEPAVDEYGQLERRLQIEQDCRSEAEKYASRVIILGLFLSTIYWYLMFCYQYYYYYYYYLL